MLVKEIDVNELKKVQLEMLEYFDAFCRKNKIRYWLDYGTLLGAIRHKGYIPWDDDVDQGCSTNSRTEYIFFRLLQITRNHVILSVSF